MDPFQKLLEWVKNEEKFVGHVYDDGYGNLTIGYGDTRPEILKKYRKGITELEAAVVLADLLANYWSSVSSMVRPDTTDNQRAAFTSLAYNIGLGGFEGSTTLARHNAGDTLGAVEALKWWNKAEDPETGELIVSQGLVNRRQREADLYLAGERPKAVPLPTIEFHTLVSLVCMNSGLVLDVDQNSMDQGASLQQWTSHCGMNQGFALVAIPEKTGEVAIVCGHSGMVLDVAEYSTENGARIQQWPYHGGPNQRWRVFATGNVLQFQNVHSGKYLDIEGLSVDVGARLIQYDNLSGLNQMFMRVRREGQVPDLTDSVVVPPPPTPDEPADPPVPEFDVGAALRSIGGFPYGNEEDVYGFQAGFSFWELEVDGIAGPETRKAIQYSIANGGRCGKYFTFSEFACRHCGRCRIAAFHVRQLDLMRAEVGPITIISGTRCEEHNAAVGGARNSQHRPYPGNRGVSMASDIPGIVTRAWLKAKKWFSGIGYVPSEGDIVVHVDSRGDGPNNTTGGTRSNSTDWAY